MGSIALGYERLRFLLLDSKWLPKVPLGILVWSALHVLLVVGGASLELLLLATFTAFGLAVDCFSVYLTGIITLLAFLVIAPCSLIWLLMRVMLCNGEQFRVAWKGFEEMWNSWWELGRVFLAAFRLKNTQGVFNEWYPEGSRLGWRLVGRWCEEVVHLHHTLVI